MHLKNNAFYPFFPGLDIQKSKKIVVNYSVPMINACRILGGRNIGGLFSNSELLKVQYSKHFYTTTRNVHALLL
jgi:hypothetical protein